jgi:phage terminase small subunit
MMPNFHRTLTPEQLRWAEEFLVDGNGKAAAMRAGWSSKLAKSVAARYIANAAVMHYVKASQSALLTSPTPSQEEVIQELRESFETARQLGNPASMQAASREIARINGYGQPNNDQDKRPSFEDMLMELGRGRLD